MRIEQQIVSFCFLLCTKQQNFARKSGANEAIINEEFSLALKFLI